MRIQWKVLSRRFLAVALPISFINGYCFSIYTIAGGSMKPTFNPDDSGLRRDRVLVDKITPWFKGKKNSEERYIPEFRNGDVVLFTSPKDPGQKLVKRIVALEGETVLLRRDNILEETQNVFSAMGYVLRDRVFPCENVTVPPGKVWVEADEPYRSLDSKALGPIPLGLIEGRVMCIIWPLDRIGPVPDIPNKKEPWGSNKR